MFTLWMSPQPLVARFLCCERTSDYERVGSGSTTSDGVEKILTYIAMEHVHPWPILLEHYSRAFPVMSVAS